MKEHKNDSAVWPIAKINETCYPPQYGLTESASWNEDGPKFLRITDLTERGVNWNTVPSCKCSPKVEEKFRLKKGDIVFARIGATTGKSHYIDYCPNAVFASYLIRLRTKEKVQPEFLSFYFKSDE